MKCITFRCGSEANFLRAWPLYLFCICCSTGAVRYPDKSKKRGIKIYPNARPKAKLGASNCMLAAPCNRGCVKVELNQPPKPKYIARSGRNRLESPKGNDKRFTRVVQTNGFFTFLGRKALVEPR